MRTLREIPKFSYYAGGFLFWRFLGALKFGKSQSVGNISFISSVTILPFYIARETKV